MLFSHVIPAFFQQQSGAVEGAQLAFPLAVDATFRLFSTLLLIVPRSL